VKNKVELKKYQVAILNIIIHISAWLIVFSLPLAVMNFPATRLLNAFTLFLIITSLILFYLNFYALVPLLLLKRKFISYFLIVITLIILSYFGLNQFKPSFFGEPRGAFNRPEFYELEHNFDQFRNSPQFRFPRRPPKPIGNMYFWLMIVGVSTSLKLSTEWFKSEKNKEVALKEHFYTELAFLKAQINPHFLFNSLNSIYSLAHKKSDLAPEAIIRLSKMMRYILDEAESSFVPVEKELDHITDYIELQKLRLTEKTKLSFNVSYQATNQVIEPMLLIPFVENAFKHGTDSINQSVICINIMVDQDSVSFRSTNTVARFRTETVDAESGVGLTNVKRRLALLYPNQHSLEILHEENLYSVTLRITLNKT